jgi:hypothetical protein
MRTRIEHREPISGDPWPLLHAFTNDPVDWLPGPARPAGPGRWRVTLHAGPARRDVIVEVAAPWSFPDAVTRFVHWWAEGDDPGVDARSRLLPEFNGRVSLRHDGDEVVLDVWGWYEPPVGVVGAVFDVAGLRQVAHASLRWFARTVAEQLTAATRVSI